MLEPFDMCSFINITLTYNHETSRLVHLWAYSESRFTSPLAARYSTRFDCTVRLRVLCYLLASRRAGVDLGLVFLPCFDFTNHGSVGTVCAEAEVHILRLEGAH